MTSCHSPKVMIFANNVIFWLTSPFYVIFLYTPPKSILVLNLSRSNQLAMDKNILLKMCCKVRLMLNFQLPVLSSTPETTHRAHLMPSVFLSFSLSFHLSLGALCLTPLSPTLPRPPPPQSTCSTSFYEQHTALH